jgi:hypothetical protein
MMWLFAVLIVLAMAGIAMVASGRGGSMAPAYDDQTGHPGREHADGRAEAAHHTAAVR